MQQCVTDTATGFLAVYPDILVRQGTAPLRSNHKTLAKKYDNFLEN
jgi:hypothetical protein